MDATPLQLLERDTYSFFAGFADRPDGATGEEGGAIWFRSGVSGINYNGVLGACVETGIDAVIERAKSWGLPARWILNSQNTPEGFEAKLAERGLEMFDEWPGMIAPIENLPEAQASELNMEPVRSEAEFDAWADVFADAFRLPAGAAQKMHRGHQWPCFHDRNRQYFLFYKDGRPVATGTLHNASPHKSGVAGVYGISVRRAFQKRGFGKLATQWIVREGAQRGAKTAVLQASTEGFPVYQRLGFETICSFRSWRLS